MKDTYHMIFKNTKMQWNELNLVRNMVIITTTQYIFLYTILNLNEQRIETVRKTKK